MYIVLLKSLTKQENRHPESSLWGEGSALISPAHRAVHILAPFNVAMPTSYTSNPQNYACSPRNYKSSPQKSQKMNEKYAENPFLSQ
jgi:hypothetical protein